MSAKWQQSSLEWSILEIDEEEWQQRTAALDTAAAANGFPVAAHTRPAGPGVLDQAPADGMLQAHSNTRQLLAAGAGVLLVLALLAGAGYRLWYTSEQGVAKLQQDVGSVVELDAAKARAAQPQLAVHEAVEAVEFLDGKAMAQVVITRTLPAGQVSVEYQAQFYVQTAQGWVRTQPVAAFWGPVQTLDTSNLHFVFRRRDRAAVQKLAPGAEALYVTLRRATRQSLAPAGGRLTIEIVPKQVPARAAIAHGRVRLQSPILFYLFFDYTADEVLASLTRTTLAGRMFSMQVRHIAAKPQWQPMVVALGMWFTDSDALPLAVPHLHTDYQRLAASFQVSSLHQLLGCGLCTDPTSRETRNVYYPGAQYDKEQQAAAAVSLLNFIVATYGIDVLSELLQGFGRYDDWETLAPAVFGTSAAELESAWHHHAAADS